MDGPHQAGAVAVRAELELVADQLRDPLIPVLLAAVVLTVATGDLADASVTVLVIVVTTVRLVQEVKVGEAIAALSDLTARRPGWCAMASSGRSPRPTWSLGMSLVPAEGDIVPADANVTDVAALLVDEAALTPSYRRRGFFGHLEAHAPPASMVAWDREGRWCRCYVKRGRIRQPRTESLPPPQGRPVPTS